MTATALRDLRSNSGLTDVQMAKRMGLTVATYKDLESGAQPFGRRHELMLDGLALELAVEFRKARLPPVATKRLALDYAALFLKRQAAGASVKRSAA